MTVLKKTLRSAMAAAVLAAGLVLSTGTPANAATCPSSASPKIDGAQAHWTLSCTGGKYKKLKVYGWVEDTRYDGKCAYVNIRTREGSLAERRACDRGTRKNFDLTFYDEFAATVTLRIG
ncbi:hypothetical protein ABZZ20_30440 [Streptomyces sp. NPDC006430]|uniref:hypothetical protein n=1 Tax=Streptomyces sp. NPDC006430 TaxID=3154299 RepID=UPI0033A7438B